GRRDGSRPGGGRDDVERGAAAAHQPWQRERSGGPQGRAEERPEAQHRADDMHGAGGQRALPGAFYWEPDRPARTCRRSQPQAPAEQGLGEEQPPVAERSERGALAPAPGLPRDRGKGAGEAGEAEQGGHSAQGPGRWDGRGPASEAGGEQRQHGREQEQRYARTAGP